MPWTATVQKIGVRCVPLALAFSSVPLSPFSLSLDRGLALKQKTDTSP